MCGLVAVHHRSEDLARSACSKAMVALTHRGPDGEGQRTIETRHGSLSLGHRRLAILDLTEAGAQPMCDPETENVMVYNGEVYNFRHLRNELSAFGTVFRGSSDTEVVLAGYRRWGTDVFDRLRGMFAIVLWDSERQRIIVARDHAGMKPLYWYQNNTTIIFASEMQAIVKTQLFEARVNQEAISSILAYGSVLEPNSIVQGIEMVPAGNWGTIQFDGEVTPPKFERFWSFPTRADIVSDFDFRVSLEESVKGHLESDVPVGVFLSSGVDSTAIAETASKFCGSQLRTLTIGFGGNTAIDETVIAEETARRFNTSHQTIIVTEDSARNEVENWLGSLDQPSLDGFNTYLVSRAARSAGLKVALSGLGGDELFGGYNGFRTIPALLRRARYLRLIPQFVRHAAALMMLQGKSESTKGKALDFIRNVNSSTAILFGKRRLFSTRELLSLRGSAFRVTGPFAIPLNRSIPEAMRQHADVPAAISAFEAEFYMKDTLLRDSDISGMAHGLEIRMPLLDRDLMEAALRLPQSQRMGDFMIKKPRLVAAAGPRTRELSTHRKRGFSLPYATWIRGPLRDLFEHGFESAVKRGFVAGESSRKLLNSFVDGTSRDADWSRIWTIGVLGNWLERMNLES